MEEDNDMERNESRVDNYEDCSLMISTTAFRFRKYMARICGEDDTFGLKRDFLRFKELEQYWGTIVYNYGALPDGVYEASVKYYNSKDDDSLFLRDRKIVILYDDDYRMFPYNSVPRENILEIVTAIDCGSYEMPPE